MVKSVADADEEELAVLMAVVVTANADVEELTVLVAVDSTLSAEEVEGASLKVVDIKASSKLLKFTFKMKHSKYFLL